MVLLKTLQKSMDFVHFILFNEYLQNFKLLFDWNKHKLQGMEE